MIIDRIKTKQKTLFYLIGCSSCAFTYKSESQGTYSTTPPSHQSGTTNVNKRINIQQGLARCWRKRKEKNMKKDLGAM